jgi:hypothetical protein
MYMQEYNIAKSEHLARNAALNNRKPVEGITIRQPGLLDRAMTALRRAFNRDAAAPARQARTEAVRGAPAR